LTFDWVTLLGAHEKCLEASFELAARQQHASTAALACQPDVRAQTHDHPVVASARMRLLQPNDVADREWHRV
jgi:hypothetical protein